MTQGMCRAYCHKLIKLSGALQEFAPEKEVRLFNSDFENILLSSSLILIARFINNVDPHLDN
jgi:hypothetical protein